MNNLYVSLEKEVFTGNVLDITYENKGIIYNTNKYYDNSLELDYIENSSFSDGTVKEYYDSCILFFSLSKVRSHREKTKFFKNIYNLMRENGYIYIWDVEKKPFKTIQKNITVSLPDKSIKKFQVKLLNLFTQNTSIKIEDGLKDYFDVLESISSDGTFRIVGRKKGC